jgi:hypothetical protein
VFQGIQAKRKRFVILLKTMLSQYFLTECLSHVVSTLTLCTLGVTSLILGIEAQYPDLGSTWSSQFLQANYWILQLSG